MDHCINLYRIPKYVLTDNWTRSASTIFESLNSFLRPQQPATIANNSQTNGWAERSNMIFIARLGPYVTEHEKDLEIYVQPSTYAYNTQGQCCTNLPPFSSVLTWQPSGTTGVYNLTVLPTAAITNKSRHVFGGSLWHWILTMRQDEGMQMKNLQSNCKTNRDRSTRRALETFDIGQNV